MGVASFVLGLLGLIFCFVPCVGWIVGLPLAGIGLLFGLIGLKNPKKGLAIAGLVLSIVGCAVGIYNFTVTKAAAETTVDAAKDIDKSLADLDAAINAIGKIDTSDTTKDVDAALNAIGKIDTTAAAKELEKEWNKAAKELDAAAKALESKNF